MPPPSSDAPRLRLGEEPALATQQPDDIRLWSVTTIIGTLDKPALVPWAAIETAKAAIDKAPVWKSILENDGRDEAVNYLKGARFRRGKGERSATELGTAVHKACERKVIDGRYREEDANDKELRPFLLQFDRFLREFRPEFIAAEVTVFSPTYGYAGTADAFLRIDGIDYIVDYKTSKDSLDGQGKPKGPYPEVALQLAAYRHAELAAWKARQVEVFRRRYYLLSDAERDLCEPVPEVDHGLVIYLTPERYAVHPIRCDAEVHDIFLHVIEGARFVLDLGKEVIGNPLIAPTALHDSTDPFAGVG